MRISESNLRHVIRQVITEMQQDIDTTLQTPATQRRIEKFLSTPRAVEMTVSVIGRGLYILPGNVVYDSPGPNDISGKIELRDDKYYIVSSDSSTLIWSFLPGIATGEIDQS
jgi:hypothetical protein